MSVAILVLAHRAPAILSLASAVYREAGFDVFVHLDAKVPLETYCAKMSDGASACRFIEERVEVFWAGFSMISATVALLRAAQDSGEYSNFVLVSDDTFPVRPIARLRSALVHALERIDIKTIHASSKRIQRYERFFFFDHPAMALRGRQIEASVVDEKLVQTLSRLQARKQEGKARLSLFHGSQWCGLTRGFVEHFLHRHDSDRALRESFEFSAAPDEMYIHCVMMNSTRQWKRVPGPVLTDWSRYPRPYIFQDCAEIEAMIQDEHLFARKLAPEASELAEHMRTRLVFGRQAKPIPAETPCPATCP